MRIFELYSLLILALSLFVNSTWQIHLSDAPIVTTNNGQIRGISDDYAFSYLGIPYALPPVTDLRWEEPIRARAWYPNILNATELKPACPQVNCSNRMPKSTCPPQVSEDCLYLDIYVPKDQSSSPKAVMLFIHGGNFQYQGANSPLFDARIMSNISDTIIVIIQYRLGVLGFLFTGIEPSQIQGNFGILDQRMAIKWIYENIEGFGGDPNRITLFGQSAGGESVTTHLLSQDMQGYFQNVIIQSSPMSIPFRSFDEAMAIYDYFAQELNCQPRDVICLRNQSLDAVLDAQMSVETKVSSLKLLGFFEPWLPWIDGKLIKGQLLELEKWGISSNNTLKPFILGTLSEECWIYIYLTWPKPLAAKAYTELMLAAFKQDGLKFLEHFPPNLGVEDQRNLTSIVATQWVFGCSGRNFLEQAVKLATQQQSKNSYYHYVFDFPLDFDGWDKFTFCNNHVCHGSDVPYTFESPDANFTTNGVLLSQSHIEYWTNFAKYGNPNGKSKIDAVNWPSYDIQNKTFLRFKAPPNSIEQGYLKEDCDFFDSIGYYH